MIQSFIPTHYIYLIGIYLTYVSFPLKLTKVACLIQGVWYKMLYHHTMVIKERLCRTTLSWRHIIGMWDTKNQYKRDSNAIRLFRIISIPSKFCYFRLPDHVILMAMQALDFRCQCTQQKLQSIWHYVPF
jgi:hypothetical protein